MWPMSVCLTAFLWVLHSSAGLLFFIRFQSFSLDSHAFFFVGRLVDFHEKMGRITWGHRPNGAHKCAANCGSWHLDRVLVADQILGCYDDLISCRVVPYFQNGTKHWNQDHYTPRRCSETATVAVQVKMWKIAHLMDRNMIKKYKNDSHCNNTPIRWGKAREKKDFSAFQCHICWAFQWFSADFFIALRMKLWRRYWGTWIELPLDRRIMRIFLGVPEFDPYTAIHTHTHIYIHCIHKLYKWWMTGINDGPWTYWDLTLF